MCPPLIAAIPMLGGMLTTTGTAATAAAGGLAAGTTALSMPAVLTALSIASTGAGLMAQGAAAKRANAYNAETAEMEREEARDRAEEELGETITAQREARARALVAAGESGVGGASLMASMNQSIQDQDMDAALAQKNVAFSNRATDRNLATNQARGPSGLSAGLQLATAGVSGYQTGLSISKLKDGV